MDQVPEGQSFVHLTPEDSFRRLSPFKLQREMDMAIGPCVNAKVIRSGNILIRVFNKEQARLALSITTFCGTAVTAAPATRLNTVAEVEPPRPSHPESTETVTTPVLQAAPTPDETDTVIDTSAGAAQPLAEVPTETQPDHVHKTLQQIKLTRSL
ncbi:hypothetical protein FJT64_010541 [Amphibalanus amphitrite]|uniref:Uncharacterized protein n=1 Tax=Amphibalanus amphitrite TaxID=1232801 RepID=A0A6A4VJ40_AMPAM|nr:hypothetical protein FJT64_010541 [Amphibalanus amphitrite]